MSFYGGHDAPKTAASTLAAFLWLHLTFLNVVYASRWERLEQLGLLPLDASIVDQEEQQIDSGEAMRRFLAIFADILKQIHSEIEKLPNDSIGISAWAAEILGADLPNGEAPG